MLNFFQILTVFVRFLWCLANLLECHSSESLKLLRQMFCLFFQAQAYRRLNLILYKYMNLADDCLIP